MAIELQDEQQVGVSIEFLVGDHDVPVPELNRILDATQQAIYTVGAYDTGRTRLRGDVRRQYTLGVASSHHSDLFLHLVPITTLLYEQLPLFESVAKDIALGLATNLLYDAAKVAFRKMKDHYEGKPPDIVDVADEKEESPEVILEQGLWQTSCQHAAGVAALGQSVRTSMRTPDGTVIEWEATPPAAKRIIEQNAERRSQVRRFRDCELMNISIPGPTLRARIPFFGGIEIRCESHLPVTTIAETRLRLHDKYSIVGSAVWKPGRLPQKKPTSIEVTAVEDEMGHVIFVSIPDAETQLDTDNEGQERRDLFSLEGDEDFDEV